MKSPQSKWSSSLKSAACNPTAVPLALLLLISAPSGRAQGSDNRAPDVPAGLEAPGGTNKVHFHAYAIGYQIYHWNAALGTWGTSTPAAFLYDADGNQVGVHFAGPTWESNSGSFVRGSVLQRATPDPTAIPWLLLRAVLTGGPGIFKPTTYIQRVNTVGGKAPATPGLVDGEEADVPYTAEYFFYREQ